MFIGNTKDLAPYPPTLVGNTTEVGGVYTLPDTTSAVSSPFALKSGVRWHYFELSGATGNIILGVSTDPSYDVVTNPTEVALIDPPQEIGGQINLTETSSPWWAQISNRTTFGCLVDLTNKLVYFIADDLAYPSPYGQVSGGLSIDLPDVPLYFTVGTTGTASFSIDWENKGWTQTIAADLQPFVYHPSKTSDGVTLSLGTVIGDKTQPFSPSTPEEKLTGWVGTDQTILGGIQGAIEGNSLVEDNSALYPNPFTNPFRTSELVDGDTWWQGEFDVVNHKVRISSSTGSTVVTRDWVDLPDAANPNLTQVSLMGRFPAKNTLYISGRQFSGGYDSRVYEYNISTNTVTLIHSTPAVSTFWSFGCYGELAIISGFATGSDTILRHRSIAEGWAPYEVNNVIPYTSNTSTHNRWYYDPTSQMWRGWIKTNGTTGHRIIWFSSDTGALVLSNKIRPIITDSAMHENNYYAVNSSGLLLGIESGKSLADEDWEADLGIEAGAILRSISGRLCLFEPSGKVSEVRGRDVFPIANITPYTPFNASTTPRLSQHDNPEQPSDNILLLTDDGNYDTKLTDYSLNITQDTINADLQWLPSPTPVIPPLQWDTTVAATSTYTYINPTQVRSGASTWDGAVSDERSTGKLYMEYHFEQYASEYNVVITPAPEALGGYQGHFKVGTTISNEVDDSAFTGATTSMSGKYSTDTGLGCNAILYDIDTNTVTVWNADTVVYTGSFASTIGDLVAGKADPVTGFRAGVQSYYTGKWTYCNFGQDLDNYPWAYPHRAL